jgi:hypothetical protein
MTLERTLSVDDVARMVRDSEVLLVKCEGSFVDNILYRADCGYDILCIELRQVPNLGGVTISVEGVRYFNMDKPPEIQDCFVDSISATYLPGGDGPWPDEAERRVTRFPELPDLVMVCLAGPAAIEVIGDRIVVSAHGSR